MEGYRSLFQCLNSFDYSEEMHKANILQDRNQWSPLFLNFDHNQQNIRHQEPSSELDGKLTQVLKTQRKPAKFINNYPTKNCLAMFKAAHFAFLQKTGIDPQFFQDLSLLQKKNGASKADFVTIYKIKDLSGIWSEMFKTKFLYHYLMTSRVFSKQKRIYLKNIYILESAFETKQLNRLVAK